MLRLDPILETGVFDAEFFGSEDYSAHHELAKHYLKEEGFESSSGEFVIQIAEHWWHVRNLTCDKRQEAS